MLAATGRPAMLGDVKRLLVAAAAIAIVVGFALWWFSPRQVILRRTRSLLDTVTIASR